MTSRSLSGCASWPGSTPASGWARLPRILMEEGLVVNSKRTWPDVPAVGLEPFPAQQATAQVSALALAVGWLQPAVPTRHGQSISGSLRCRMGARSRFSQLSTTIPGRRYGLGLTIGSMAWKQPGCWQLRPWRARQLSARQPAATTAFEFIGCDFRQWALENGVQLAHCVGQANRKRSGGELQRPFPRRMPEPRPVPNLGLQRGSSATIGATTTTTSVHISGLGYRRPAQVARSYQACLLCSKIGLCTEAMARLDQGNSGLVALARIAVYNVPIFGVWSGQACKSCRNRIF